MEGKRIKVITNCNEDVWNNEQVGMITSKYYSIEVARSLSVAGWHDMLLIQTSILLFLLNVYIAGARDMKATWTQKIGIYGNYMKYI